MICTLTCTTVLCWQWRPVKITTESDSNIKHAPIFFYWAMGRSLPPRPRDRRHCVDTTSQKRQWLFNVYTVNTINSDNDTSHATNPGPILRIFNNTHIHGDWPARECEPIIGVWGGAPSRGPGAEPPVGVKGAKPLKLARFCV